MIDEWKALYGERWAGDLVPEAYAHPAKMARGLTRRIYDHMREEGWLPPGALVLDPFGGIAGTALEAMLHGCGWVGVELEPRFVALAQQNLDLWRARYAALPGFCGEARIVQGDSRELLRHVAAAGCVVGSPPFCDRVATQDPNFLTPGEQSKLLPSKSNLASYGTTPGQLGAMRAGDFGACVSSPPYEGNEKSDYTHERRDERRLGPGFKGRGRGSFRCSESYGTTPGQLGAMRAGDAHGNLARARMDAAVSSPPYEKQETCGNRTELEKYDRGVQRTRDYGDNQPDDFWSAASQIVAQTHAALAPGGHAVWVVKGFVRNKALVDFPGQWRALCESAGFTTLHEHHAMLTEHRGAQHTLDGGTDEMTTERKSFFRRLAEKKGSPRVDWETVYCMERT